MSIFITYIDTDSNVAFCDRGGIYQIESYLDEQEDPCLVEDAIYADIRVGSYRFVRVNIMDEDSQCPV